MQKKLSKEKLMRLIAKKQLGINLDKKQKKFLELIKEHGVCVNVDQGTKNNPEFQELIGLLSKMHQRGIIPSFQIINA